MDAQEVSQLSTDMLGAANADGLFLALDALDLMAEAVSIIGPDDVHLYSNAASAEVFADLQAPPRRAPADRGRIGLLHAHGNPLPQTPQRSRNALPDRLRSQLPQDHQRRLTPDARLHVSRGRSPCPPKRGHSTTASDEKQ